MERGPFHDAKFVKPFNDGCVPVAYVTSYKNWPTVDLKDGKNTVTRSSHFPRCTVDELKALRRTAPEALTKLGSFGTPAFMVFDPDGQLIRDQMDRKAATSQAMLEALAAAQKKLGTGAPIAPYRELAGVSEALAAALDNDDYAAAVGALAPLARMKNLAEPLTKWADDLRAKLTAAGESKIAEAEGYAEVDPEATREELEKLLKAFKGHPLEKKIRDKLRKP